MSSLPWGVSKAVTLFSTITQIPTKEIDEYHLRLAKEFARSGRLSSLSVSLSIYHKLAYY